MYDNREISILHLEDSSTDALLISSTLRRKNVPCTITLVQLKDEYETQLRKKAFDLILSDFRLPLYDGFQALRFARENVPHTPFILVTGQLSEEEAIQLVEQGATDYVLKDRLYRLVPTIMRALRDAEIDAKRRKAEEELRILSHAVGQSPISIVLTDPSGTIEYVNPKFTQLTGYTADEAIGQNPRILKTGYTTPEQYADLWRIIKSGQEWEGLFYNRKKNGEHFWERAFISPIKNDTGEITHFVALKEDITERKRAEDLLHQKLEELAAINEELKHTTNELMEQRHLYYELFDSAPDAYIVTDPRGGIREMNNTAAVTLNSQPPHAFQKIITSYVATDDHEMVHDLITRLQQTSTETIRDIEVRIQPMGKLESFPASLTVSVVRKPDGETTGLRWLLHDITERKQFIETLRRSEMHYRMLFETMTSGFAIHEIICDDTGKPIDYRFLQVNPGFEKLTGLRASDIIGKTVREVIPQIEPIWIETYGTVALTGKPIQFEQWNGALKKYYDVVAYSQQPGQFATIFTDVTDRKLAEQEIRRLNIELEERVRERTAQLAAANRELEAFSYSVSHDLRAPLRSISGFARLLVEDTSAKLTDDERRHLDLINESAKRMSQLIEELLTFSRLNKKDVAKTPVNMRNLVELVVEEHRTAEQGRTINVTIHDIPPAQADYTLIRQVWENLISNAFKFTRRIPTACLEVGSIQRNGECVYYVKDNGAGFDMKYYDKLFSFFQRLHAQEDYEGTGVGLATVQRIINRHGGRVWAEATEGNGATFYFSLPS